MPAQQLMMVRAFSSLAKPASVNAKPITAHPLSTLKLNLLVRGNEILLNNRPIATRDKFNDETLKEAVTAVNSFLKGANLSKNLAALKIFGDMLKKPFIEYCIMELLQNACDAIVENGTIQLTINNYPDQIEILCEDNGLGIAHPKHIFKYEWSLKTKELLEKRWKIGGNGVGLYFIRLTLNAIKGKVNVLRTGKRGTKMQIMIPKRFSKLRSVHRWLWAQIRMRSNFLVDNIRVY